MFIDIICSKLQNRHLKERIQTVNIKIHYLKRQISSRLDVHSVVWIDSCVVQLGSYSLKQGDILEVFVLNNMYSKFNCRSLWYLLLKLDVWVGKLVIHWCSYVLKQGDLLEKFHDKWFFRVNGHQLGNLLMK